MFKYTMCLSLNFAVSIKISITEKINKTCLIHKEIFCMKCNNAMIV